MAFCLFAFYLGFGLALPIVKVILSYRVGHPQSYHVTNSILSIVRFCQGQSGVLRHKLKPLFFSTIRRTWDSFLALMNLVLWLSKVTSQVASGNVGRFLIVLLYTMYHINGHLSRGFLRKVIHSLTLPKH